MVPSEFVYVTKLTWAHPQSVIAEINKINNNANNLKNKKYKNKLNLTVIDDKNPIKTLFYRIVSIFLHFKKILNNVLNNN